MAKPPAGLLQVEVVYALPERQTVVVLTLPAGSCVADALAASGLIDRYALPDDCPVGIFATRVDRARPLADGDRVEIYRPLEVDPKQARRLRAAAAARRRR